MFRRVCTLAAVTGLAMLVTAAAPRTQTGRAVKPSADTLLLDADYLADVRARIGRGDKSLNPAMADLDVDAKKASVHANASRDRSAAAGRGWT